MKLLLIFDGIRHMLRYTLVFIYPRLMRVHGVLRVVKFATNSCTLLLVEGYIGLQQLFYFSIVLALAGDWENRRDELARHDLITGQGCASRRSCRRFHALSETHAAALF